MPHPRFHPESNPAQVLIKQNEEVTQYFLRQLHVSEQQNQEVTYRKCSIMQQSKHKKYGLV